MSARTVRSITTAVALAGLLTLSPVAAASAHAAQPAGVKTVSTIARTVFIPEWYQYCYNTRPVGITVGKSGYMNAYSSSGGVTCKWWVMPWRAGIPHTTSKYYTWDTVCRYYGSRYVEMKRGYPWCR